MKVNPSFELLKSLPSLQFSTVFPLRTPSPIMVWIWTEWSFIQDLSLTTWFLDIKIWESFPHGVLCFPNIETFRPSSNWVMMSPTSPKIHCSCQAVHPCTISTFRNTTCDDCLEIHQFHNQKKPSQKSRFHHDFFESTLCQNHPPVEVT